MIRIKNKIWRIILMFLAMLGLSHTAGKNDKLNFQKAISSMNVEKEYSVIAAENDQPNNPDNWTDFASGLKEAAEMARAIAHSATSTSIAGIVSSTGIGGIVTDNVRQIDVLPRWVIYPYYVDQTQVSNEKLV